MIHVILFILLVAASAFAKTLPDTLWTRVISRNEIGTAILSRFADQWSDAAQQKVSVPDCCINPTMIRSCHDGGFVICGKFGVNDDTASLGLIIKTDSNGRPQWQHGYLRGRTTNVNDVWPTRDGGFLACATIEAMNEGLRQVWILRLNSEGDTLWTRMYRMHHYNDANSIRERADGSVIVGLTTSVHSERGLNLSALEFNIRYAHLVTYDSDGNILWARSYGGSPSLYMLDLELGPNDDVYFTCIHDTIPRTGLYCIQADSAGTEKDRLFLEGWDCPGRLQLSASGHLIISGHTQRGQALISMDMKGDTVWTLILPMDASAESITQLPNGNLILAGGSGWTSVVSPTGVLIRSSKLPPAENGTSVYDQRFCAIEADGKGFIVLAEQKPHDYSDAHMVSLSEKPLPCYGFSDLRLIKYSPRFARK